MMSPTQVGLDGKPNTPIRSAILASTTEQIHNLSTDSWISTHWSALIPKWWVWPRWGWMEIPIRRCLHHSPLLKEVPTLTPKWWVRPRWGWMIGSTILAPTTKFGHIDQLLYQNMSPTQVGLDGKPNTPIGSAILASTTEFRHTNHTDPATMPLGSLVAPQQSYHHTPMQS
jgi:hypothetical protein